MDYATWRRQPEVAQAFNLTKVMTFDIPDVKKTDEAILDLQNQGYTVTITKGSRNYLCPKHTGEHNSANGCSCRSVAVWEVRGTKQL
jgi:hypothetical protein